MTIESFFTVGHHHRQVAPSGHVVLQQDGFISSVIACLFVTAMVVVLSLAPVMRLNQASSGELFFGQFVLSIVVAFSTVMLLVTGCNKNIQNYLSVSRQRNNLDARNCTADMRERLQYVIPLATLFLFLIAVLIMDCAIVFAFSQCFDARNSTFFFDAFTVCYHLIKSAFYCGLFWFLTVYSLPSRNFWNLSCVRFILGLLVTALLCLYVDFEVTYSRQIATKNHLCAHDGVNMTLAQQCVCQNTQGFQFAFSIRDLLYPIYVQFFLIATESLILMLISLRNIPDSIGMYALYLLGLFETVTLAMNDASLFHLMMYKFK